MKFYKTGKLGHSLHKEVNAKSTHNIKGNSLHENFKINVSSSPNSCLLKIGKQRYRALVGTGAECSLMHRRIYDQLKNKPKLVNKKSLFEICKWF